MTGAFDCSSPSAAAAVAAAGDGAPDDTKRHKSLKLWMKELSQKHTDVFKRNIRLTD
jgi:hypothetical protein